MDAITSGIYAGFDWFIRIVKLNMLWLFSCLAGVFIFSMFPATKAAFIVTNEWTKGNTDISVWKTFKTAFKNNYWKSQSMGYLLGLIFFILIIDLRLFLSFESNIIWSSLIVIFSIFLVFLLVISFYVFPIIIDSDLSIKDTLKTAFFTGFSYPHWTIINLLGVLTVTFITIYYPISLLFLSGGVIFLWITCMNKIVKAKIETKYEKLHGITE